MTNQKPLVSVITVNYRQAEMTCALLQSIANNAYKNIEIIIVDNGSEQDVTPLFEQYYPAVKTIVSTANLGFAGGNNLGIEAAKGDYLFFVNNDTVFTEGLIENLLLRFSECDDIGIVSPKIRYHATPNIIQYAGFTKMQSLTGRNETIGKNEIDQGQYDTARPTSYAHGAAMMVSRAAIQQAGTMPEQYFLYYEELDWCCQIQKAGYAIWYEPQALIYHKESASVGKSSPLKVYYQSRNRLLFMHRNAQSDIAKYLFFIYFYTFIYPIKSLSFLVKKDIPLFWAFQKAIFGFSI